MRISIAAPDIHIGDAVGNHCLAIALELTEQGYNCELFAQRFTSPTQKVRPLSELLSSEINQKSNDILLVSYSIYDRQLRNLLKLPGKKIVYFHGITPPELLLEHDPTAAYYCARGYSQIALLDQFDHIITNSALNLKEVQTRISRKIEETRFSIVPPISARFHIFSESARKSSNTTIVSKNPLRILTVGRVVPHKRIEDIIKLVANLTRDGQPTELNIVGSCCNAIYVDFLKTEITKQHLHGRVQLQGKISEEELIKNYKESDFLIMASEHEGFCVPVLEAMHLGLPVILRRGTAASEVLNYEKSEFTTIEDCVLKIKEYMHEENLQKLVRHMRNRSKKIIKSASLQDIIDLVKTA